MDGVTFDNCYKYVHTIYPFETRYVYFSERKFINVSPVEVYADDLAAMVNSPDPGGYGGYLLFGTGKPFRCSPVYLAYVSKADFGKVSGGQPQGIRYYSYSPYSGIKWEDNEEDATPIIGAEDNCLRKMDQFYTEPPNPVLEEKWDQMEKIYEAVLGEVGTEMFWSGQLPPPACNINDLQERADSAVLAIERFIDYYYENQFAYGVPADESFGEISVKYIDDGSGHLVMLSNHRYEDPNEITDILDAIDGGYFHRNDFDWEGSRVYYRTASIAEPWNWLPSEPTHAPGYGPYIIDEFTEVNEVGGVQELSLWHTVSVWRGKLLPGDYGVYTAQAAISPWPPQ